MGLEFPALVRYTPAGTIKKEYYDCDRGLVGSIPLEVEQPYVQAHSFRWGGFENIEAVRKAYKELYTDLNVIAVVIVNKFYLYTIRKNRSVEVTDIEDKVYDRFHIVAELNEFNMPLIPIGFIKTEFTIPQIMTNPARVYFCPDTSEIIIDDLRIPSAKQLLEPYKSQSIYMDMLSKDGLIVIGYKGSTKIFYSIQQVREWSEKA